MSASIDAMVAGEEAAETSGSDDGNPPSECQTVRFQVLLCVLKTWNIKVFFSSPAVNVKLMFPWPKEKRPENPTADAMLWQKEKENILSCNCLKRKVCTFLTTLSSLEEYSGELHYPSCTPSSSVLQRADRAEQSVEFEGSLHEENVWERQSAGADAGRAPGETLHFLFEPTCQVMQSKQLI